MKLTVKQDNLAKALGAVGRIATARAGLPILANVLIKTSGNKLIIAATNLEVAIVASIGAQVNQQGSLAVPAKLFTDFVSNLPHTNVDIETDQTKLKITTNGFSSTINSMVADDYPALPEPSTTASFTIDAEKLKAAINRTALVTSNDVTRPILTGVYLYTNNSQLYMVATDGYRLAEDKIIKLTDDIAAIVPASTLTDVTRLIGTNRQIEVKYNEEQITFITSEASITSRLIDGKFIDYQQLIPSKTNFTAVVDRAEFIKVTKVAELFARETAGSIIIEGDTTSKTLSVRSITSQLGDNTSSIDAELDVSGDDDCLVSLNSRFLLDALNCLDGEKVTMKFNGKLSPVLLIGKNDNYRHIIMPVKS